MRPTLLVFIAMLLGACSARPTCEPGPRAYEARDIDQQWIDYVWLEVSAAPPGVDPWRGGPKVPPATGRLFVASADPVGAIVPTMLDLPCASGPVEYAPAPVVLEFGEGHFTTSYSWGSCAACSECYMRWTFSLDLTGKPDGDALVADLVLNETFHSGPMPIVSVRMEDVTAACTEPRLRCEPGGKCEEIRYEGRAE